MRNLPTLLAAAFLAFGAAIPAGAADGTIAIVAAQNFYGDIARQIGGVRVTGARVMTNPDQDPHLFETT
ncbi:MAG: metal ABC transporter substrate-binding protein, partial [Pseudolabrys sp.]|nr:metal ABC transporter substrate-binding protein [Pseudolabrys sp.]